MDGELHKEFVGLLLPHVADGQVDKEVVVGLSPLQETLAALYIFHKVRCIPPDAVGRRHVDRGIELPSRPRIILGRIARAVEEHMVYAGTEHQVDIGLKLR